MPPAFSLGASAAGLYKDTEVPSLHRMALFLPYLYATDEWLQDYDTNARVNPPLRTEADRLALIEALKDGTIDCIATDHAPHHADDKNVEFALASSGS